MPSLEEMSRSGPQASSGGLTLEQMSQSGPQASSGGLSLEHMSQNAPPPKPAPTTGQPGFDFGGMLRGATAQIPGMLRGAVQEGQRLTGQIANKAQYYQTHQQEGWDLLDVIAHGLEGAFGANGITDVPRSTVNAIAHPHQELQNVHNVRRNFNLNPTNALRSQGNEAAANTTLAQTVSPDVGTSAAIGQLLNHPEAIDALLMGAARLPAMLKNGLNIGVNGAEAIGKGLLWGGGKIGEKVVEKFPQIGERAIDALHFVDPYHYIKQQYSPKDADYIQGSLLQARGAAEGRTADFEQQLNPHRERLSKIGSSSHTGEKIVTTPAERRMDAKYIAPKAMESLERLEWSLMSKEGRQEAIHNGYSPDAHQLAEPPGKNAYDKDSFHAQGPGSGTGRVLDKKIGKHDDNVHEQLTSYFPKLARRDALNKTHSDILNHFGLDPEDENSWPHSLQMLIKDQNFKGKPRKLRSGLSELEKNNPVAWVSDMARDAMYSLGFPHGWNILNQTLQGGPGLRGALEGLGNIPAVATKDASILPSIDQLTSLGQRSGYASGRTPMYSKIPLVGRAAHAVAKPGQHALDVHDTAQKLATMKYLQAKGFSGPYLAKEMADIYGTTEASNLVKLSKALGGSFPQFALGTATRTARHALKNPKIIEQMMALQNIPTKLSEGGELPGGPHEYNLFPMLDSGLQTLAAPYGTMKTLSKQGGSLTELFDAFTSPKHSLDKLGSMFSSLLPYSELAEPIEDSKDPKRQGEMVNDWLRLFGPRINPETKAQLKEKYKAEFWPQL